MLQYISWFFVIIALYGTYLNSNKNIRGFYYWVISNIALTSLNLSQEMYPQSFLFFIYTILSIRGIIEWSRKI